MDQGRRIQHSEQDQLQTTHAHCRSKQGICATRSKDGTRNRTSNSTRNGHQLKAEQTAPGAARPRDRPAAAKVLTIHRRDPMNSATGSVATWQSHDQSRPGGLVVGGMIRLWRPITQTVEAPIVHQRGMLGDVLQCEAGGRKQSRSDRPLAVTPRPRSQHQQGRTAVPPLHCVRLVLVRIA